MVVPGAHAGARSSATASAETRGGLAGEVERQEALVAGLLHVPAVRGGEGADLALVAVHRHGRQPAAALRQHLLAERALGGGEQLVHADGLEARRA